MGHAFRQRWDLAGGKVLVMFGLRAKRWEQRDDAAVFLTLPETNFA